jgi:DNA-binding transcriptional LysR family regulator
MAANDTRPSISKPIPFKSDSKPSESFLDMCALSYDKSQDTFKIIRSPSCGFIVALLVTLGLLCVAAPTWAATDDSAGKPVSTSPIETQSSSDDVHHVLPPAHISTPPLTRAAAQRQLDTISPADWLARYGRVDIERRR